jgi:Transglycosylase SLT domain
MANVPYQEAPTAAPRESVPDDYQHQQASPADFGGLIAQGAEKLGAGFSVAGKFFGQVQTDDAANTALTEANNALNTFRSMNGGDALRAQKPTQDAIDAAFKKGHDGLSTPEQQYQYDNIVRNYQQRYISGIMSTHADQAAKEYATKTNADGFATALNSVAGVADRPEMVAGFQQDARAAAIRQLQVEGTENDPVARQNAIRRADQAVAKAQIQAIAVNDPIRAQRMVENYKEILGVDYEPLAMSVLHRATEQKGIGLAKQATGDAYGTTVPQPVPATLSQVQGAIRQQESGNRDAVPTSVTGAVGPNQIQPATFQQYAHPGENIANAADNRAVGDRILADYYQRYNGDPYRIAVAYFSGPGNVAPQGAPTPWIKNSADPTGKTVASYVGDVATRLGAPPGPYALRDAAYRSVMTSDQPEEVKQVAFREINRSFTEAQIAAEADGKAKKDANESAATDYVRQILTPGGATQDLIQKMKNDPRLTAATLENLYGFAANKGGLDDPLQYGPNYSDVYRRILLPPGDGERINDANDILKMGLPGGGLSAQGVQKSLQIYGASRKDPDQASVNQVKSSLIQYAKSKLSFDQEMLFPGVKPLADPKGVQVFNAQFIPRFEAAYDAWIKEGKNPWEFLTQENVDKLMTGMRPKAQMAMDRVSASDAATGEKTEQAVPPKPQGVEDATWQEVMQSRPLSPTGRPVSPANWWSALKALQQNPTPENIAYFNKEFSDVDGAALLKKLQPGKASVVEARPVTPEQGPEGELVTRGVVPLDQATKTPAPAHIWQRLPSTLLPPELRQ